ncbi:MAG: LytTR family DNA-binding domain-containing protein [Bacteroidetes bacterium]|nr:LytTR family DNA-binding domain-containing protein [Bacteroidota bacterium]
MITRYSSLIAADSPVTQTTLIRIPNNRGVFITAADQIVRIEALSNYSKIYFISRPPLTVAKVLQWFEPMLPPGMFSRVHRSHLVNKLFIQQIIVARQNTLMLSNGEKIQMSRRKKALLMAG